MEKGQTQTVWPLFTQLPCLLIKVQNTQKNLEEKTFPLR